MAAILDLVFYATAAGNEPVRDWLRSLPAEARKTIGSDLWTVQTMWPIGKPLVDSFGGGLWEVRSTYDKVEYRVLVGLSAGVMYALHGFTKNTKTTTKADKELGYARLAEVKQAESQATKSKRKKGRGATS
jgi:phage-related protein